MVEFAFVSLLFLAMLGMLFEGARLVVSYFAVANAAAAGARAGAFVPTETLTTTIIDAKVREKAREALPPFISLADGDISICRRTNSAGACGSTPIQSQSVVEVTTTYSFALVPFVGGAIGRATNFSLSGWSRVMID
jgi:Flp pilus assembly protein TadG